MNIPFSSRSKFFGPIQEALDEAVGGRDFQRPIKVLLDDGGYPGSIRVRISRDSADEFAADWERSDWTRIPARIRAAATALRDRGCYGRFLITHQDGALTIAPD